MNRTALPAWPIGDVGRRAVLPIGVVGLAVTIGIVVLLLAGGGGPDAFDPRSTHPGGAKALATLLAERGVITVVSPDLDTETGADAAGGTTIVLGAPDRATPDVLLAAATAARSGSDVVLVGADPTALAGLHLAVAVAATGAIRRTEPACVLPEAAVAGDTEIGGYGYASTGADATACYPIGHGAAVLVTTVGRGRVVLIGTAAPLTNERLAQRGDAALGVGLLARHPTVHWVVPPPAVVGPTQTRSLVALLPARVKVAAGELVIAALLAALWRGRRLGPPVVETLPVTVRAAETVQGRARLYQAGRARGRAADALRIAARRQLSTALGGGHGSTGEPARAGLIAGIAARTHGDPHEIESLLYAADRRDEPADDAALVRLADRLDELTRQVLQ